MRKSTSTSTANTNTPTRPINFALNQSINKPSIQERQDFIDYMMKAYLSDSQIMVTVHNNLGTVEFTDNILSIENSEDIKDCTFYFENGGTVNINFSGCIGIKPPVGEYDGWDIGNQTGHFSFWMDDIERIV